MSDTSPILALPFILPAQAQKHVTHNEALRILDVLVQTAVATRGANTPPATPATGDRHITGPAPTGLWAGQPDRIAVWEDPSGWFFLTPQPGWQAHVVAEDATVTFIDGQWRAPSDQTLRVSRLGVGTDADATNRLAVASPATLLTNAGAGHQVKVNKAAATDTASLLFQTGWSGRAEMGTAGNDDFSVKVSADGTTFAEALVADRTTGRVRFPEGVALGALATDPAAPSDGWMWFHAPSGQLRARIQGTTQPLSDNDLPWMTPAAGDYVLTCGGLGGGATGTLAGAANRIDIFPFSPRADVGVDRLAVNCTTGVAAAQARIVVYSADATGRPDTLLAESDVLDLATTGNKLATLSMTLHRGRVYWIGVRHSSTATLSAWPATATPDLNGGTISTAARKILRRTLAFATPAPATWGYSAAEIGNANATAIWLRVT